MNKVKAFLFSKDYVWQKILAVTLIFLIGLGIRLINFSNPPLDIHVWRQLRSASIARGMYYDMLPGADAAVQSQAHYLGATFQTLEPTILERLSAWGYRMIGQENLAVPRAINVFFWLAGGLFLYDLSRRMTSFWGGLVSLAFYLLLPFGVSHSRAFIPEPQMIFWVLAALWALYQWGTTERWKWALLTGIFGGIAILVKVFAVYPLVFAVGFFLLSSWGFLKTICKPQFWVAIGIMALIPAVYYFGILQGEAGGYIQTWTLPYLHLLTDFNFYLRWLHKLHSLFNLAILLPALLSVILLPKNSRALVMGLWIGYFLMGCSVPSLIRSHIYYNLILIPIVGLSLSAFGDIIFEKLNRQPVYWRLAALAVILVMVGETAYQARKELVDADYHAEPAYWETLGKQLPTDGKIIGLSEDYNTRIQYYGWRFIAPYPYSFDQEMANLAGSGFDVQAANVDYFLDKTKGYDYFLITMFSEFEAQPYLKTILMDHYPILQQDERMMLFDLRHPLSQPGEASVN